MPSKVRQRALARNPSQLPLVEWADQQRQPKRQLPTPAERRLRRCGFKPSTAALYASLAGFPVAGDT